jgi:epoxide hydrolase 4
VAPKRIASRLALSLAASAATVLAARRIVTAPPDAAVAARAEAASHSGPWTHSYAQVDGVRLHYAEMGTGSLVILLHGFPQCWYTWHYVMPQLAARFHVVAPDMRGYNLSDKPKSVAAYTAEKVSQDIAALIETLGETRAHVVGHDWGGSIAWHLGIHHPERVDRLVVINAPHPAALVREFKRGPQLLRSWYAFLFQLPLFPEALMRLSLRRNLHTLASIPAAFSQEAVDVYANAIAQPGALTAMLNYYRAAFRAYPSQARATEGTITHPTLLIWGMKDFALLPCLSEGLEQWVPNLRIQRIEDSGHWVPEEKPRVVADALLDFLTES